MDANPLDDFPTLEEMRPTFTEREAIAKDLSARTSRCLEFLAGRLVEVYGESSNVDFILHARSLAQEHARRS